MPRGCSERWQHFEHVTELRMVGCLDRNLSRAAQDLVAQVKRDHPDTTVTVLLPRRTYSALLGRLLHDRTADKIAGVVSRIPGASAQIVAYDIASRVAQAQAARGGDSNDPDRSAGVHRKGAGAHASYLNNAARSRPGPANPNPARTGRPGWRTPSTRHSGRGIGERHLAEPLRLAANRWGPRWTAASLAESANVPTVCSRDVQRRERK